MQPAAGAGRARRVGRAILVAVIAMTGLDAEAGSMRLVPLEFSAIPGWSEDSHADALAAFRRGCARLVRSAAGHGGALGPVCARALELATASATDSGNRAARAFFEAHFTPHLVISPAGDHGLVTGYYEPDIAAARGPSGAHQVPILGPPPNLVAVAPGTVRAANGDSLTHALSRDGGLVAAPPRAEIAAGALEGEARPIAWLADPVDAFFLHVQGSGRLVYDDGTSERVTYAGKNGHPYTSIGKLLAERGIMAREDVTMDRIRAWLGVDAERGAALMNENRSYIFFRRVAADDSALGPIGQLEVALTPGRSLAVDLAYHQANMPVWIETMLPARPGLPQRRFRRLMIAQDTGSAIRGPVRGDVFFGSGEAAGAIAGRMRADGRMIALVPRCRGC